MEQIENLIILDEPTLQFANGQDAVDPHDGLTLFGPYGLNQPTHPHSPTYIILGAPEGISLFEKWSILMNKASFVLQKEKHRLWPPYPGFEVAFGSRWSEKSAWSGMIDRKALIEASKKKDPQERSFAVVEMFMDHFKKLKKLDYQIGVAICVIPDEVWRNCRTQSQIAEPSDQGISSSRKKSRKAGQTELFDEFNLEQYHYSPDFRRQLKARTMKYEIALQIIRESTLIEEDEDPLSGRGLTFLSDRMWNLGTALYYKSGGKPWRLNSAREGVCYIGIAFKLGEAKTNSACCAAQMFLDTGDGIVFLGDDKPIYSPLNRQFALSSIAAEKLLRGVLDTYKTLDGRALKEIFIHCRSEINKEQWAGYQKACPDNVKMVGIRIRPERNGPRLYRIGSRPVLRGTFWRVHDKSGYLYCSGFKPRIATYDGWETPVPLKIDVQYGDAPIEVVAKDILGLTKLNYNACRLGESEPVTIKFSNAVGEILISNPTVTDHRPNFKYYI
ncbi:MAG: hypothetical protein ACXACY_13730 [Candidatus Hodarchaeales archaeon]